MEHTEIILKIMEERGITAYRMAKETGISESLFGKWKEKPSSRVASRNLVLIADYLGCSVDYLVGRTEDPAPPPALLAGPDRALALGGLCPPQP